MWCKNFTRKFAAGAVLLIVSLPGLSQTHLEYISEKSDSMAIISKEDIDVINSVFHERNILDSLHDINEQIIYNLEQEIIVQDSIIINQKEIIDNDNIAIHELELKNELTEETYSRELKREKNKKISFQALSGVGIIAIILILLI